MQRDDTGPPRPRPRRDFDAPPRPRRDDNGPPRARRDFDGPPRPRRDDQGPPRYREQPAPAPRYEMEDEPGTVAGSDSPAHAHRNRDVELRVFGVNACLAVFARRPAAVRKVYLLESRMGVMRDVLQWCAREKIGYRLVESEDLRKLTGSEHHEGVCFEVLRAPPQPLAAWLAAQADPRAPSMVLMLDGVGNPHNFGAVLRIAAHFGVAAVLLPPGSALALSGAACRVAEGGAEVVPLVALDDLVDATTALERAGYTLAATVVRGGEDLYADALPARLVLVFGAEGGGVSASLLRRVARQLRIPGTGDVESLNIASAVGVACAEFWRQHRAEPVG